MGEWINSASRDFDPRAIRSELRKLPHNTDVAQWRVHAENAW